MVSKDLDNLWDKIYRLEQDNKDLQYRLKEMEKAPAKQSLWSRIKQRLSEQGSQRGIIALFPLIASRFDLSPDDMLAIFTFTLAMMGINNIVTKG